MMMIDTTSVYRRLTLFCLFLFVSSIAFAQRVCDFSGGTCTNPTGITCVFPSTTEKGCNCFDGVDNDGDGKIDSFDTDCAYYYGLSITNPGSNTTCPQINQNNSNTFTGISNKTASSQNTADTPAHLSVGDMDGDGIPDVAVTSKWNSTVQIVATTTTASGFSAGDVMSDFTTPGSDIFKNNGGLAGSGYVFEHETAIADIDGDKIGEVFVIASYRGGSPNNVPQNYWLCGFKYVKGKGNLKPLWQRSGKDVAIPLGNDRPGSIGLADFNGDGRAEVYLRNQIFAAETGYRLANGGGNWDTEINAGPVAADINNDGKLELICGNYIYTVPTLSSRNSTDGNGSLTIYKNMNSDFPSTKFYPKGYNDVNEYGVDQASSTSVADVDNDGYLDVFMTGAINCSGNEGSPCGTNTTTIFYWNVHNNTLQTYAPPDATYALGWIWGTGRINLYNVITTITDPADGGRLEALFTSGTKLFCMSLDAAGTMSLKWSRSLNDALSGILSLTCYDFDNDGKPEVIYRDTKALVVCDGQTGATTKWSADCASHTFTEGPIIADVNGDGATDICVTCYTNFGVFDITKSTPQQQSLGQTQLYYTDAQTWLPTRKVWNEHPYYVTNILDDLTLPKTQVPQTLSYNKNCPLSGGVTLSGPQQPFNLFMDQVPYLDNGCPTFPRPDLTFYGDIPSATCTSTTDPACTNPVAGSIPTVQLILPQCGNLGIQARFNIQNTGNLGLTATIPVSFFNGDPRLQTVNTKTGTITCSTGSKTVTGTGTLFTTEVSVGSVLTNSSGTVIGTVASITSNTSLTLTANAAVAVTNGAYGCVTKLYSNTMTISNLGVDQNSPSNWFSFNGPGSIFDMYIVLYDNGSTIPISTSGVVGSDCSIANNIFKVTVGTLPFTVQVDTVQNNHNCPPYNPPNNGQLKTRVFIAGVEQTDLSPYSFQWYTGSSSTTGTIISGATNYNLPNLDQGTYTVKVTNTAKGCSSEGTNSITRVNPDFPAFKVNPIQNQTVCSPANGELTVTYLDGTTPTGYTFTWMDLALIPIGVTGADAKNLLAGTYKVQVTRGVCIDTSYPQGSITGPTYPDAQVTSHTDVVDCLTPNSGSVTGDAVIGGVVQNASDYTFTWYYYNNATGTTGSVLPASNNDPTDPRKRINLAAGWYQLIVKKNSTQCSSSNLTIVEVKSSQVIPTVDIFQKDLQTSCDASQPNGKIYAVGSATGFAESQLTYVWYLGDNTLTTLPKAGEPEATYGPNNDTLKFAKGGGTIYTVKVITPNNCSFTNKFTLLEDVNQPVITLTQTPNDVCDPTLTNPATLYDGTVTVSVTFKGVSVPFPDANYTFNWYDGVTTGSAHTPPTTSGSTIAGLTINGLQDGKFFTATATRTDLHCISASQTIMVQKASIQPILQATSTGSNNCDNTLTPDGTATVNIVTNPLPAGHTYTYQWYEVDPTTGAVISTLGAANTGTSQTATFIGGPYTPNKQYRVDVIDRTNGCTNNTTQSVSDVSVIPVLSTTTAPNSICSPSTNFNGSFTVSLTNPVGTYVYPTDFNFTWYNSTTNDPLKLIGAPNTTSDLTAKTITLNKLDVGDYAVIGKNTKTGCTSSVYTNKVITAKVYPALLPSATGSNNCDVSLTPDGTASYSVTNMAQADVTQKWYYGTGDPSLGGMTAVPVSPAANQGEQITAKFLGGPYNPNKTYSVLVTNTITGCQNYTTATVPDNSVIPVLGTTTTPNSVCDLSLGYKGTFTASLTNPVGSYVFPTDFSFTWKDNTGAVITPASPPTTSPYTTSDLTANTITLNNLDTNPFTVIATNTKTGCVSAPAGNTVANNKVFPVLTPSGTGSNNCVADGTVVNGVTVRNDGSATVNASGTPGGYTYQWFTGLVDLSDYPVPNAHAGTIISGQTAQQLNNVGGPGGTHQYTVYVKDQSTGCSSYGTAVVPDNGTKPVLTTTTTPNDICSPATSFAGTMTASLSNVQIKGAFPTDYTFVWSTGTTTTGNPVLTKLDAGSYNVVGTNNTTGCVSDPASNQVADLKANPVLTISSTGSHNCSTTDINGNPIIPDGTAIVDVTAQGPSGADTFTYTWTAVGSAPVGTTAAPTNVASPPSSSISKVGGPNIASPGTPFAYNIVVKNNRTGCSNNGQAQVADASAKPTFALQAFDNTICDPSKTSPAVTYNGHIDVNGTITDNIAPGYAGTITHKYTWTDVTNPVVAPHLIATQTNVATASYTSLPGGDYTGVVTIVELGCVSDPVPAQVKDVTVTPVITATPINNTNCVPAKTANGSVSVTDITESGVSQALTNYTYQWYDSTSAVLANQRAEITATGPSQIRGLKNFTVQVVSKSTGCPGTVSTTIVDAKVTPVISVSFISDNTNCTGTPNGVLQQSVTPIGPSYNVSWFPVAPTITTGLVSGNQYTQLAAGTYGANATDPVTGCKSTDDSKTVGDSFTYPSIAITPIPQSSCDPTKPNGELAAVGSITSGSIGSTTWYDLFGTSTNGGSVSSPQAQPDATQATITGLTDNVNYTVEVIAAGTGCSTTQTSSVGKAITYPVLSVAGFSNATVCSPTPDGSATFAVSGLAGATPKYDLYYAYTSAFGTLSYPSNSDTVKNLPGSAPQRTYSQLLAQTTLPIASYNNMAPGYLTAVLVDKNNFCESNVITQEILDKTSQNKITLNGLATAGFCKGTGGGVSVSETGAVGAPTFAWYSATPTNSNINFFTNPPTFPAGTSIAAGFTTVGLTSNLGMPANPPGIGAGTYTVVVTDANGCGAYFVANVPFANAPTIVIDTVNVTKCVAPYDGSVKVTVTGISPTGYTIQIYDGNSNAGTSEAGPTATTLAAVNLTAPALKSGDYYIEVIDQDPSNKDCPLGSTRTLKQLSLPPKIDFAQINPNTSCVPGASADGSISVTVTDDPNDKYTSWTTGNPAKNYEISNIVANPSSWTGAIPVGPSGTTVGPINGFKPQAYTVTVTETNLGCTNNAVVNIPDVQDTPSSLTFTATPETMCANSSNGDATVSIVGGEVVTDFDFTWSVNSDLTTPDINAVAGASVINKTQDPSWPMGATPGQGNGDRTFYVQGVKNATAPSGFGCKTPILQVDIPDQHISPDMTLTPAFDSFCQATAANNNKGDGVITVLADADPSSGTNNDIPTLGFIYDWTPVPTGVLVSPTVTSTTAGPISNIIKELHDGTYTVTVTNKDNNCSVVKTAVIAPAPYVLTVDATDPIIDQRICNSDGWIQVSQVTLQDATGASIFPPDTESVPGNLNSLYKFYWYNNSAVTPGTELQDAVPANIVTRTLSNDGNQDKVTNATIDYPGMKAGTYYVIAQRNDPTKIGYGCPTVPFRVDIQDLHQNPVPSLAVLSNTSCDPLAPGEGEIFIKVTTDNTDVFFKPSPVSSGTPAPATPFTYNYTWSGGNALTLPGNGTGNGNGVNDTGAPVPAGDQDDYPLLLDSSTPYSIDITNNQSGCTVTATATVLKNSVPVFVQSVTALPQILCDLVNGDGSITVDTVKVNNRGGTVPTSTDYVVTPGPSQGNINNFTFDWSRQLVVGYTQTTAGNALTTATYDNSGTGFGIPIGADTYTVVATRASGSPGRGCKSAPFTVVIKDERIYPSVTLTPFSNTSCDNTAAEGEIKIAVKDNTTASNPFSGFTYSWTSVPAGQTAPTAAPFRAANDGDGFGLNILTGLGENDGIGTDSDEDHPMGLLDGTYTMTVQSNKSQCITTASTDIPKNATPVFVQTVIPIDPILCAPLPDGSLTVREVTLNASSGVQTFKSGSLFSDFQFEWTRVGDATGKLVMNADPTKIPTSPADTVLNKTTYLQTAPGENFTLPFGVGSYTVVVRRKAGSPGANCASAPYTIVLQDKSINPVIALKPFANTACSGAFEGEIEVTVTDATSSNSLNTFTTPFKYNYTNWTTTSTTAIAATIVMPNGANNGDVNDGGTTGGNPDGDGDNPKNLQDGDYTVTVVNPQTGCSSTGTTTIYKNSTPVFTQLVTPTDQVLCTADGKLVVDTVKVIDRGGTPKVSGIDFPISDFGFIYDRTTIGNNVLGTTLSPSPSTQLNKGNYASIGFDTYFVTATRVNGSPGFGCSAAPYKVDILDKRIFPSASLTPLANTSCDPNFFEGEIKVAVADANNTSNPSIVPVGGFTFDYQWTVVPVLSQPVLWPAPNGSATVFSGNDGDGFGGGEPEGGIVGNPPDNDNDHPKALTDGDYTIQVTNTTTGCASPGQTTIFKNSTPVFTQLVTSIPQVFCKPSGHLTVKEVKIIDRNGVSQSNLNGDFPLSDFTFTFDRTTVGNTVFVDVADNTPHLDSLNYPAVVPNNLFDTYYVTAKRATGFPGKDCPSAPYRVDIEDKRIYPTVSFRSIANSTCPDPITGAWNKANGSLTAIASEPSGANTDPYTFSWTLNGSPIASVTPMPVEFPASPKDSLANALDGTYVVTVTNTATGCPFDASFDLLLDETRSTPNIIDVATIDPIDCNPTAGAEVTKITLGSTTNSSLYPPQVPPDNTVVAPNLGPPRFMYSWYEGALTNPPLGPTTPCIGPACPVPTTGLLSGDHWVTVIDQQTNCQSGPKQFTIKTNNIIYPVAAITQTRKQIKCPPDAAPGSAILLGSATEEDGTTGSYNFNWYPSLDGTGTTYTPPDAPSVTNNPNTLQNLPVGNYSLVVQNTVTSCYDTAIFIVPDDSPLFKPAISTGSAPQTFCVPPFDGDVNVRVILDPSYPLLPYDNTSFQTDLYKGTNPNLSNPPDIQTNIPFVVTGAPGAITYDVSQASNPLLTNGKYTFRVTDLNTGCFSIDSVEIKLQQTLPVVEIGTIVPMTNCDPFIANGQITSTADGGKVQGYDFRWFAGSDTATFIIGGEGYNILSGQDAGTFTVKVRNDITGCFDTKSAQIDSSKVYPPSPAAVLLHNQTLCFAGQYNGHVTASVGGITQGYSFTWYYEPDNKYYYYYDYDSVKAGDYVVTAKDDETHCKSQASINVPQVLTPPTYDIVGTPSYCADSGLPIGTFTLTPTVNDDFTEIAWSNASDTSTVIALGPVVMDLYPGDYHVHVITVEGCESSRNVKIETEIKPYNLVSPSSLNANDRFTVDCISNFPGNNVKIFNRNGTLVYEADGYDNRNVFFRGIGEKGVYLSDKELPEGTYFYIIDKRNGAKPKAGFLELVR